MPPLSDDIIAMVALGTVRWTFDVDGAGNICHHNGRRRRRHGAGGVVAVSHGNIDSLTWRNGFAEGFVATALRHGLGTAFGVTIAPFGRNAMSRAP